MADETVPTDVEIMEIVGVKETIILTGFCGKIREKLVLQLSEYLLMLRMQVLGSRQCDNSWN